MLSSWLSIPARLYRRFSEGAPALERIHEYYAKRTDSEDQLRQEVLFAVACGREYAENIARELGRPTGPAADLSSLSVLELGPGINFGAGLVCAMLGARVAVFDKYLVEWHEAYHPRFYRLLRAELAASDQQFDLRVLDQVIAANRHPDGVIETGRGDLGAGRIDLETGSFDAIVSNAALEHVEDVPKLCAELWRVTRPGGVGIHQIDFRDHSSDRRPLDFLAVPDDTYARTFACGQGGGGNRVRPSEFRAAFKGAGFDVIRFDPNCFADGAYVEAVRPGLLPRYASLSVEELRVVGGRIFLKRRSEGQGRIGSHGAVSSPDGSGVLLTMDLMNTMRPSMTLDELYEQLLTTYADLGYQRELVGHWALPGRDLRQLVAEIEEAAPLRLLEVGTFVGLSTLAMAFKTGERAVIHTVDPNFPLEVELQAMQTQSREADLTVRSQALAREAAERLGLAHKIVFHAGGFSTPATFASTKTDPAHTAPVVGPDVCRSHGPFDLIFIDGLHYSDAVLNDLRLASPHLRPGGRIVLHDVIGCWGSNVRRAVYQFLAETPGWTFRHGRYADLYEAIGVIEQATDRSGESVMAATERPAGSGLLEQPGFAEQLAAVVYNLCRPLSALCLGSDPGGLLAQLGRCGVEQLISVGNAAPMVQPNAGVIHWESFDHRSVYRPRARVGLCLCITDEHDLRETSYRDLVASCAACSDTILFCSTPPGEAGTAGRDALPIERWVREFWKHGYRFHDSVRPSFEPLRFANSLAPVYDVRSTALANIYLVRRDSSPRPWSDEAVEALLVEKERRIEDLALQGLFSDVALRHALKEAHTAQQRIEEKDHRLLGQEQTIADCRELVRQSEASVRVLEGMLARSSALVQEQAQAIAQHRQETAEYQRRITEQGRVIAAIEQSLEYRVALGLGRYPRLLRLAVRCWRALFHRQ